MTAFRCPAHAELATPCTVENCNWLRTTGRVRALLEDGGECRCTSDEEHAGWVALAADLNRRVPERDRFGWLVSLDLSWRWRLRQWWRSWRGDEPVAMVVRR